MTKMCQTRLEQHSPTGTRVVVGWLPLNKSWAVGDYLELKGESGWWHVTDRFAIKEREEIHSDWEVGGIGKRT